MSGVPAVSTFQGGGEGRDRVRELEGGFVLQCKWDADNNGDDPGMDTGFPERTAVQRVSIGLGRRSHEGSLWVSLN